MVETTSSRLGTYLTPGGADRMRRELNALLSEERPKIVEIVSWAAGNGDRSENGDYIYGKRRLHEIDRRIRFLRKRLENAVIVDPSRQEKRDIVYFGAIIDYIDEEDRIHRVRIVGSDEARIDQGEISLISPLAQTLLRRRAGDEVVLKSAKGETTLEITSVSYDDDLPREDT